MEDLSNEFNTKENVEHRVSNIFKVKRLCFWFLGIVLFLFLFYYFFLSAPSDFLPGTMVRIDSGMNLRNISSILKKEHIIRSRTIFESFIIFLGGEKHIVAADYLFENKLSVWQVAKRIEGKEYRTAPVSVTIPEGFNVGQIADLFETKLNYFNKNSFLLKTKTLEGYLFPDTYFFLIKANEDEVIRSMNDNFKKKIAPLLPEIISLGKTEKEIVTMASLIEGESKGDIDREFISGILWKRITIGMPLQVDAAPSTYKGKGLPQNPISNPGLKSIQAAMYPKSSPYLYYLHDINGNIHYAKTFAEHVKNKLKYLDRKI
jgi:UPF0755 protein